MTVTPGRWTASVVVAAALVLLFLALEPGAGRATALVSTLALGFATPVWSVAADGIWPQTLTVFGIAGMAWASVNRRWWWAGVFGGVALWSRLPTVVIVATLGIYVAFVRRAPLIAVKVAVTSSCLLGALCAWTRWMYGSWDPTTSYDSSTLQAHASENWHSLTNQLGFWISPDRGILVWTPILLLLLPALVRSWSSQPDWVRSLLIGGLIYSVLQSGLNSFVGGAQFYGYRYGIDLAACATPAFAFAFAHAGRAARLLTPSVLSVQVFAIATGAMTNNFLLPETDVWRRNAFVAALDSAGLRAWVGVVSLAVVVQLTVLLWRHSASTRRVELPASSTLTPP